MTRGSLLIYLTLFGVLGCAATQPPKPSAGHIKPEPLVAEDNIPAPVRFSPFVPAPVPQQKQDVYTVVVSDVSVKELLFALARDAKINVDVHPGTSGSVTINAIQQTLLQILARISEQVPIRYTLDGNNLVISPDAAFLRTYKVNYVNMARNSSSSVSVATQVASTGRGGSGGGSNGSTTAVQSTSDNEFWATLVGNIRDIIGQQASAAPKATGDKAEKGGKAEKADAASHGNDVIANVMSGILTVRATQRQHREIQQFIDQVIVNAQRQVLIEATIVEVELSDRYQAGVDWKLLSQNSNGALSAASTMSGSSFANPPAFLVSVAQRLSNIDFSTNIGMLETFGNVRVLSSPKIMALNNQTAILKVVDEKVYFDVTMEIESATANTPERKHYSSSVKTVPVGLIMSVVPQVNENGVVTMNVRPTITRITGFVSDPALRAQSSAVDNLVPEIQVREMESLLQVRDGQTVVLGGLMQNKDDKKNTGVPWLSTLPWVGNLFNYKDDNLIKTELVIFLKPVVVRNPDINGGDLAAYRSYLLDPQSVEPAEKSQSRTGPGVGVAP